MRLKEENTTPKRGVIKMKEGYTMSIISSNRILEKGSLYLLRNKLIHSL